MIKIIDDWYLDSDDASYVLKRDTKTFDKNGKKVFTDYSYYGTLERLFESLINKLQRKEVQSCDEIVSYFYICKKINLQLMDILKYINKFEVINDV